MKRVFLCLSHQTHLLKEHLIKLKLNYVTYYVLLRSPFSVLRSTTFYYVLRSTFYVLLRSTFYVLRSTFYVLRSTFYFLRSTLLSDLMASSILELAVGWISSVGCTQPVVNLYTSCQERSTKASTEFGTLWRKVTTLRGYTRRRSTRSTTE